MAKSKFFDLLNGYDSSKVSDGENRSFYVKEISGSVSSVGRTKIGSALNSAKKKIGSMISFTSARCYGIFLMTFGLMSLLFHFIKDYLNFYPMMPLYILITCSVTVIISIPFLLSDKPLPMILQNLPLTDYILFEFFCIKRMHRKKEGKGLHPLFAVFLGLLFAGAGALLPFFAVLFSFGVIVYVFLSFLSSEFSFFFTFLAMPYIPLLDNSEVILSVMVMITVLSVLRKVLVGKRVLFFEKYDFVILLFLFVCVVSNLVVGGTSAIKSTLELISLTSVYFISSSLITNRRLADATVNTIVITSVPVSIYAIVQFVSNWVKMGTDSLVGVSSTFGSADVLALYLTVVFMFCIYFVKARHNSVKKSLYFALATLTFVAILTTFSLIPLFSLLIGVFAILLSKAKYFAGAILALLGLIPHTVLILFTVFSENIESLKIFEYLNLDKYPQRFENCFKIFRENIFTGIGIGNEKFTEVYSQKAEAGATLFSDSGNFFLQIGIEVGVIALVIFLSLFLIRIRHRAVYRQYVKHSSVSMLSTYSACVLVSILAFGALNSIWAEPCMYFLFFALFSLGSATLRISKKEFDDRFNYFKDGASLTSASCDIEVIS